jgi:Protein of unknown function, DUF547
MRNLWLLILMLSVAACTAFPGSFAPTNPIPAHHFSQDQWEAVLCAHVRDGVVDYPGLQGDARFLSYVALLDRIDPRQLSKENQFAFWINAYNAFAVKGIIDGYSPQSLWGRYRYFIGREYQVGGRMVNLYDLERSILIAQFHEPLMHFAIVCASGSCPKLQPWAYRGHKLDRQLDEVARAYINDPTRNRFDRVRKVAALSMIFKWFESDFSVAAGSVLAYIARYVDDPELASELIQPGYRIEYLDYDWSLNGIPPKEMGHAGKS